MHIASESISVARRDSRSAAAEGSTAVLKVALDIFTSRARAALTSTAEVGLTTFSADFERKSEAGPSPRFR
jgi:hypothetical protein